MTNEELVREYQNGNRRALEEICINNSKLIYSVVRKFRAIYAGECDSREAVTSSEDLAQYGYIGLIQAVKSYDPDRGAAFSSVAVIHIQAAICRAISGTGRTIRLPEYRVKQLLQLRKCRAYYMTACGRQPTEDEISLFLGVFRRDVELLLIDEIRANIASLDKPIGEEPDGGTLADTVPDGKNPIEELEDSLQNEQLSAVLWGAVDALGTDPAAILHGYYEDGKTYREISESMQLPYNTVTSIKDRALRALSRGKCGRILQQFAEDCEQADSVAYYGTAGGFLRTHTSATERAAMLRIRAGEKAAKSAETLAKFEAAGIKREERRQFFNMERREKEENRRKALQKLKEEL